MPLRLGSEPFLSAVNPGSARQTVAWNGAFFVQHSLALVNRELALGLLDTPEFAGQFDLRIDHYEAPLPDLQAEARFAPLASRMSASTVAPALTVRHRWPPEFSHPESGKLVLIQPWEFGSLPRHWVSAIERGVDEIWVPSQFVRDTYITSGVPGEKVVVVPNGVNTNVFQPGQGTGTISSLIPHPSSLYKFLFVGGTIARKGIDVLLDAYDRAFTAQDDVVLIIKDFGANSFYANQGAGALIQALQAKPNGARIIYLNEDMSETELAGLYAACDCLVHPYRGEGYGLPIAEAMACGKPTIVTDFGAALDFANAANSYLIPADVQRMPEKKVGNMPTVDYPFWAEPNRPALSELLRHVVSHPEEAQSKGAQAAKDIAAKHTWHHAAQIACERLNVLTAGTIQTVGVQFIAPSPGSLAPSPDGIVASANAAPDSPTPNTQHPTPGLPAAVELPLGLGNLSLGGLKLGSGLQNAGLGGLNLPGSLNTPGLLAAGDMYEDRKQAALETVRRGEWRNAAGELEACLIERPDDWDVVNALGVACYRAGDTPRALELLHQGIAASPNTRDFHHNLAFVLLSEGRAEESLENALLAFASTPDDPNLRRTVERAQTAVLQKARKLLRQKPDKQRSLVKRSPAYRDLMERYDRAEEVLKEKEDSLNPQPVRPPAGKDTTLNRLSLCMIVKNEERFLRNCLESAKDIVDEIVIVDTGSTDGTLDIAREYGAKIVPYEWNDDFSEARNLSLEHATGNWALWLDADEEIAPGSGSKFREAMQNAPHNIGGYMVTFHNWLTSATRPAEGQELGGEMAVHHACRLFRRVDGVKFEGRIHEQNLRSLQALGYTYARFDGLLIDHFGYAGEIMSGRNKHERFIRMLSREVDECPDEGFRDFHLFNLGNAYFTFGDMENAARNFSRAAQGVSKDEEFGVTLFVEWSTALHRMQQPWEGLDVCALADSKGFRQAGIEFSRGYCLLHTEQYEAAEMAFRAAIDMGREEAGDTHFTQTGDVGASTYKARYGLALALVGQDRHVEAIPYCQEVLEEQPNMVEARYLLAIILTQQDRTWEAGQELETVLTQQPGHEDAIRDLGSIYYAGKEYERALPHLRHVAWQKPGDDEAQARLAGCCEQLGLLDEARDGYENLRRLRPESVEVCVNLGRVLAGLDAPGEALEVYAEAIQRDPTYGNAYFNAGDLIYQLGVYDKAAEMYEAGLEVSPEQEGGFFVLGNCYFHTEAYAAAVISYRQELRHFPTHQEARQNLALAEQRALEVGQEVPAL